MSIHFYNQKNIRKFKSEKSNLIHILFVVIHITNKIFFFILFRCWEKSLNFFFSYTSLACRPIISEMSKEIQLWKKENQNLHTSKGKCFPKNEQKEGLVKDALPYPEPNTKFQTVKRFSFILDSCRMEQHLTRQAQGGGTGPLGSRSTNQRLGFQSV